MNEPLISEEQDQEQVPARAPEQNSVQHDYVPRLEIGSEPTRPLSELEEALDYTFENREDLKNALVHKSYLHDVPDFYLGSNERLEFLGDAVLGLIVPAELFIS